MNDTTEKFIYKIFTENELGKIKRAVMSVEAKSAVEIVPAFDQMSDEYTDASTVGALYGALITMGGLFIYSISNEWEYFGLINCTGIICLGFVWGGLLPFLFKPVKRFFIGKAKLAKRSQQKAQEHFITHNVFNTKDRTGVLIHLSMFEHAINIIGDEGINKLVKQSVWDEMVLDIKDHIIKGDKVQGIIDCIERCGQIVADAGLHREENDENELDDHLRSES